MPACVPWEEKHEPPSGFGTWCPRLPAGRASELLAGAVADPGPGGDSTKLYAVDGEWCFVAHPSDATGDVYHGYPVPGAEVPERVLRRLVAAGRLTRGACNRLRRQQSLPEGVA